MAIGDAVDGSATRGAMQRAILSHDEARDGHVDWTDIDPPHRARQRLS